MEAVAEGSCESCHFSNVTGNTVPGLKLRYQRLTQFRGYKAGSPWEQLTSDAQILLNLLDTFGDFER